MKVLERMAGHASGPYHLPAIDVRPSRHAPTTRCAVRSAGSAPTRPSSRWRAASTASPSRSASAGWEIRKRNVIRPGEVWGPGQIMDDGCLGAELCLDEVQVRRTTRSRAEGYAVGVGLGLKNSGLGNGFKEITKAVVRFGDDGTVEVRHGWTEMGQGVNNVALQVAVEELGLDPARSR